MLLMKKEENMLSNYTFVRGMRDGIPICLGYFAVSFALGIAGRGVGMNAVQAFVMSLTMVASAGQFAAITLIGAGAGIIEMITTTIVVNLRYLLMSCSLTQKLSPETKLLPRLALSYCMTDEIFGLSISVDGFLRPVYTYGITMISVSGWCLGTVLGVVAGNILPALVTNALGVAMYGMFLAIIIPPSRKNKIVGIFVLVSFAASGLAAVLPGIKMRSDGTRTIILTIVIASAAALLFPVKDDEQEADEHEQ